jgi:hypothetical protein
VTRISRRSFAGLVGTSLGLGVFGRSTSLHALGQTPSTSSGAVVETIHGQVRRSSNGGVHAFKGVP